jgi:hypothetical protein
VDHAPVHGGWMERWRSLAGRGEALEIDGGARLRPKLVEVNISDLEKTRFVNRYRFMKLSARVSEVATEGSVVMGTPIQGRWSCNNDNLEERETKSKKKTTTGQRKKTKKEERGGGRREGKRSCPPPL